MHRFPFRAWSLFVVAVLLVSACTADEGEERVTPSRGPQPWRGGTLRLITFRGTAPEWDPSFYLLGPAWPTYSRCLVRTLYGYNGMRAEEGGTVLRPDLAEGMAEVSADGLTWTIRMKQGIRYAPPFEDTEIVAGDIVRALLREADPEVNKGSYAFYYSVIEGFDDVWHGRADTIAGLETPDDHTLVVHLTEPTGDLGYRLALPATAPIPEGAAEGHPRDYFRFLVASGPYMIAGSEDLDFSWPPDQQEPVSGFVPRASLALVRNPSWDPAADPLRAAYVDRIEFELAAPPVTARASRRFDRRMADAIEEGTLDLVEVTSESQLGFFEDAVPSGTLFANPSNGIDYIPLSLATPPFDDVHVRRAVNLVVDREMLAGLGPPMSDLLWHVAPGSLVGGLVESGWRPAWAEAASDAGDTTAARREMAMSRYDRDGDGRCDDPVCVSVNAVDMDASWARPSARSIIDALDRIGIELDVDLVPGDRWVSAGMSPSERIGFSFEWWWMSDFPSASTFFVQTFDGGSIRESGNSNLSLLGATREQLGEWGYPVEEVPNVDARIERCLSLVGSAETGCWAQLDLYLMEEIVPDVPIYVPSTVYISSPRVAQYAFDQAMSWPALDRIALVPGSD